MDLKKEQQILLSKQRIKYIDALRGFTMFLVVLQHIEMYRFWDTSLRVSIREYFSFFSDADVFLY